MCMNFKTTDYAEKADDFYNTEGGMGIVAAAELQPAENRHFAG